MINFSLSNLDGTVIDANTFRWVRRSELSLLPPVVVAVDGKFYQIANFSSIQDEYLTSVCESFTEMLNLSIAFYNNISIAELCYILNLTDEFQIPTKDITLLKTKNINSEKYISAIKKLKFLPDNILAYLHSKEVPLKLIPLLVTLDENHASFLGSYISKMSPSVQSFKVFLEQLVDFKDVIKEIVYENGFEFPDRKSQQHINIDNEFATLNKNFARTPLVNSDYFETSSLSLKLEFKSYDEFQIILSRLSENKANVEQFFKVLKEHDIH